MSAFQIAIVDDHMMVIEGLKSMLDETGLVNVTFTATSAESFQEKLPGLSIDVLLLDINLPGKNGLELCSELSKSHPDLPIIALSNFSETAFIKNMMRSGAKGYLLKNTKKEELIEAVKTVSAGDVYLPDAIRKQLLDDSIGTHIPSGFVPKLSRREKEVLELIAEELTSSEIADKLFISLKTVESHRKNLHQKLNARNSAGLIKTAIQKGLIDV